MLLIDRLTIYSILTIFLLNGCLAFAQSEVRVVEECQNVLKEQYDAIYNIDVRVTIAGKFYNKAAGTNDNEIKYKFGYGTGALIGSGGKLVTARHVAGVSKII